MSPEPVLKGATFAEFRETDVLRYHSLLVD
jgi:hypothetical protein